MLGFKVNNLFAENYKGDDNENHYLESGKVYSFRLLFVIMSLLLFLSIVSCSFEDSSVQNHAEKKEDSKHIESVKVNGVTISVGDNLNTVYDKIGRGIFTIITNDPADTSGVIISHDYVSGDKTYRVSSCRVDKGDYHICKISLLR